MGKGNCATLEPLQEQIEAGALGLKIHEDWGSTPAVIDASLTIADKYDVQVAGTSQYITTSPLIPAPKSLNL